VCTTTKGQAKRAWVEAVSAQDFYQLALGTVASSSTSADGQDPDENWGPPKRQLPGDKIGSNNNNDDDEEEKKKKTDERWTGHQWPDLDSNIKVVQISNSDSDIVQVRVTKVAVQNINQVSTTLFPSLPTMTRSLS
jgi:hypothetical protein